MSQTVLRLEHAETLRFARRGCELYWQGLRDGTSHPCTCLACSLLHLVVESSTKKGLTYCSPCPRRPLAPAPPCSARFQKHQIRAKRPSREPGPSKGIKHLLVDGGSHAFLRCIAKERSSSCGRHGLFYVLMSYTCLSHASKPAGFASHAHQDKCKPCWHPTVTGS